ncbi:hypothetical protein J6590_070597 [Homalodisca vitripennis]|nr:hypothetical protein J6590_070597 [Homalodisca vitripennis]
MFEDDKDMVCTGRDPRLNTSATTLTVAWGNIQQRFCVRQHRYGLAASHHQTHRQLRQFKPVDDVFVSFYYNRSVNTSRLLGWVTAERSYPCKQHACPAIGDGSEVTFKPLDPGVQAHVASPRTALLSTLQTSLRRIDTESNIIRIQPGYSRYKVERGVAVESNNGGRERVDSLARLVSQSDNEGLLNVVHACTQSDTIARVNGSDSYLEWLTRLPLAHRQ